MVPSASSKAVQRKNRGAKRRHDDLAVLADQIDGPKVATTLTKEPARPGAV
jgi:hypothetical protein